jgi:hypothetical protein
LPFRAHEQSSIIPNSKAHCTVNEILLDLLISKGTVTIQTGRLDVWKATAFSYLGERRSTAAQTPYARRFSKAA